MRRKAWMVGLASASIALSSLCGCSWDKVFPSNVPTLPNAVAVDRALRLCSLSEGDQPFHLVLDITPPSPSAAPRRGPDLHTQAMMARIEIFWLNPLTYRTEIQSRGFSQVRIVNGGVVEEHDIGDFYPRWIQNFVDALLNPVPHLDQLRNVAGSVPVGLQSHACIANPTPPGAAPDPVAMAQLCFQNVEPRIASGVDFTRSVWFDDFAPFGSQQIARTLVNDLPANILVHGRITRLEPLAQQDYSLLRAKVFTPQKQQILTAFVSTATAQSLLGVDEGQAWLAANGGSGSPAALYVRTDRTGRVREAYRDPSDQLGQQDAALARALTLRFKPLLVNGVPYQMEAPLILPANGASSEPSR
jgi:hypothetical protein